MAQIGSKLRAVLGTVINYLFNSNKLHLLCNIFFIFFTLYFLRHVSALMCLVPQYVVHGGIHELQSLTKVVTHISCIIFLIVSP
jgi:hypothetical protein